MEPISLKDVNYVIARNLILKSKILIVFFSAITIFQIVGIILLNRSEYIGGIELWKIFPAPLFILFVILDEIIAIGWYRKVMNGEKRIRKFFPYLVTGLEASAPTVILFYIAIMLPENSKFNVQYLLNSPPIFVYFIFIVLSSFFLDLKVSIYVSLVIALEYTFLVFCFEDQLGSEISVFSGYAKGVFYVLTGIAAGFVSKKIKESIIDSLESKNVLIHELDRKVKERTVEIEQQKEEVEAQRDQIESQRYQLEKKNNDITDSIVYARRIQTAILPTHDLFDRYLKDYFIYFKPKDIVSGDFYWAGQKNGCFYFSAVDCTGHGVPGSLVSMLANTGLENAIRESKIISPAEILTYLNKHIVDHLHKEQDSDVKDGMDIALIKFDPSKNLIEYCGANNPLFIVRNHELEVIKANRQPIGNVDLNEVFTNHSWQVESGDRFYIFSDGYPDQFGGPKNKKFMRKTFKRLILDVYEKPMGEQLKIFDETLEKWKDGVHQTDDICIIGFEV